MKTDSAFEARILLMIHIMKKLLCLWMLSATIAYAQTNERVYEEFDFRFVTPGARAIAMGKTFVGLADDATAAYSNPAGLSNLLEQEISFEMNSTDIDHHRFVPSETAQTQEFGERVNTPSFFSYALPVKNFTFSFFRNAIQDYAEDFEFSGRFIPSLGRFESGAFGRIDIDGVNYGAGASYLIHSVVSIGGSLVATNMDLDIEGRTGNRIQFRNGTDTKDSGTEIGAVAGVLIKPVQNLSIGAVFHKGSTFRMTTSVFGRFVNRPGGDLINLTGERQIEYVIPDRFSVGTSYRFNDHFTGALDISRIFYSQQITDRFLILDNFEVLTKDHYFIKDVTEIHAGAEYRFYYQKQTIALRTGIFTDPDHQLRFRALPGTDPHVIEEQTFRFNSLPQDTDVGYTFGAGIALANRFQIDSAFSFIDDSKEIALSFVVKL